MANKSSSELLLAAIDVLGDCELMGSAKILVSVFQGLFFNLPWSVQAELLLVAECGANNNVEYKLKALITFADSLVDGQEYRRAVVSSVL